MITPYIRSAYRQNSKSWLNENIINIENFGGGMNNVEADNVINDNEGSDTKNMRFVSGTLMEKRHGCTENTDYDALTDKVVWIDEYKPMIGDSHLVRATAEKLYIDDTEIATLQGQIRGVNFYGKYYFVDGHSLRYYDGTNVYQIVTEPVAYLSARYNHGGGTAATNMTFTSLPMQLQQGDPVFILASSAYADGNIYGTVTSIVDDHTLDITFNQSLSAFYIDEGQPIFFYLPKSTDYSEGEKIDRQIDDEWYTWYQPCIQQLSDTSAGASYIPTTPSIITTHKGRLFIAGDEEQPHTVYMSHTTSEYYFPCYHTVSVLPNGDKIIDMFVFDTALIIGRNEDMYALYGSSVYVDEDSFYIKKMDVSTGLMCANCGALLNNYYIFLGYDGRFYKLNTPTTLVEYLVTKPLPRKIDIYQKPFSEAPYNISNSNRLHLSTVAFYNQIYFNIADDLIIVYNYDNMAWTYYTGMDSSALYTDGINFLIGTSEGKLLTYEYLHDVYSDCGEPIECVFASKRFDLKSPAAYKYFKSFMLTSHAWENIVSTITVGFEVDYFNFRTPTTFASNFTVFGGNTGNEETTIQAGRDYPASYWEIDRFNDRNLYKSKWLNLDIRARTLKVYFTNNKEDEAMRVYSYSILLSQRDVR